MRRFAGWLVRLLLAGVVVYGALFVYVLGISRQDQRRAVDAIVVLGAAHYNGRPSNVLRARLDHAAELYDEGHAPYVVVTGGMAPGDRVSEATVSRDYLVARMVPDSAIVVLPVGTSSHESVISAAEWLHDHALRRVLLVSDPFHMARLRVEARRADLEPHTSPTVTSPISDRPREELGYLAGEALKLPVVWLGLAR